MAAESGADVHHGPPRCLLGLFDAVAGGLADRSELLRRKRQRRAFSAGEGRDASRDKEGAASPVTEVLGERGPYWYFQFHEGGKRKKLYLGKTNNPENTLAAKRAKSSAEEPSSRRPRA